MDQEKAGLHEQFLGLLTANEAAIRADVRRLVPMRPGAADAMQRITLVLWRKSEEFDNKDGFRRWAFIIARYEALVSSETTPLWFGTTADGSGLWDDRIGKLTLCGFLRKGYPSINRGSR